jgi:hypothetical protein
MIDIERDTITAMTARAAALTEDECRELRSYRLNRVHELAARHLAQERAEAAAYALGLSNEFEDAIWEVRRAAEGSVARLPLNISTLVHAEVAACAAEAAMAASLGGRLQAEDRRLLSGAWAAVTRAPVIAG